VVSDFAHDPIPAQAMAIFAAWSAVLYAVVNLRSAERPARLASARSRAIKALIFIQFLLGGFVLLGVPICRSDKYHHISGCLRRAARTPCRTFGKDAVSTDELRILRIFLRIVRKYVNLRARTTACLALKA